MGRLRRLVLRLTVSSRTRRRVRRPSSHGARKPRQSRPRADRHRLAEQTDAEALQTATTQEPGLFASHPTRLLQPRPGEKVDAYLGDFSARIDVPGSATDVIAHSNLPLRVGEGDDKRPVDLALVERGDRVEPRDPLIAVGFPDALGAGFDVGAGVTMRLQGADALAQAELVGQQVFYANALPDSDVFATPLPIGTETFVQLRSPDSPRRLVWELDLPANTRLVLAEGGAGGTKHAEVVRGSDVLMKIWPPVAQDADDDRVPVSMTVDGNRLALDVAVPDDASWPVLVDPVVENNFAGGNANTTSGVTSDVLGWVRESNVALSQFQFIPGSEGVFGGTCIRSNAAAPGGAEFIGPVLCINTNNAINYGGASLGQWSWRPPGGLRRLADDYPTPNTDAYVYRADVRNSWFRVAGVGGLYSGLLSGRTKAYIGTSGPAPGQSASENGGGITANPFTMAGASNSSFFARIASRRPANRIRPVPTSTARAFTSGSGRPGPACGSARFCRARCCTSLTAPRRSASTSRTSTRPCGGAMDLCRAPSAPATPASACSASASSIRARPARSAKRRRALPTAARAIV